MGSHASREGSMMPSDVDDAATTIRIYWAFKDSEGSSTAYNGEYPYFWTADNFKDLGTYKFWAKLLGLSGCQINVNASSATIHPSGAQSIVLNQTRANDMVDAYPYPCNYTFQDDSNPAELGFNKAFVTELKIQWYSYMGMKTCFSSKVQQMFEEKLCCNFAIKVNDALTSDKNVHESKIDFSSYKFIVFDVGGGWYPNKCAQFYIHLEVQIHKAPYYDDCSDEGWKIAQTIEKEFQIGYHTAIPHQLSHYNGHPACLNIYNSNLAVKTKRTFEIFFPFDFLVIGLKFWAKVNSSHAPTDWYGIRLFNTTNMYWMSNVNEGCVASEDAYSKWTQVTVNINNPEIDGSTTYCYTDVLITIDPALNPTSYVITSFFIYPC